VVPPLQHGQARERGGQGGKQTSVRHPMVARGPGCSDGAQGPRKEEGGCGNNNLVSLHTSACRSSCEQNGSRTSEEIKSLIRKESQRQAVGREHGSLASRPGRDMRRETAVRTRKKKFYWSALSVLTTFFTIAMMGVASADQVQADSVLATPNIQNNPVTVNLSAGGSTTAQVGVQVKDQGNTHVSFPVTISASTTNLSGSTVSAPTPSSVNVNAYGDGGEQKVTVTVTSPADADLTCGTNNFFQAKVTFTATTDLSALTGGNDTDFATVNVNVAGPDCPPPPPSNTAPSVSAGGPYSGAEGSDIALSGTATDSDGSITATQWSIVSQDVSPGNCILSNDTSLTGATIKCTDNGTATVRLTATDADSASSSADAAVTITNANPVTKANISKWTVQAVM
jgi:hypothetical protein